MSNDIKTFRDVIAAWPSLSEFAKDIGVSENTAKLMRFRDSVAPEYWPFVVDHAKSRKIKGISLELLHKLRAEKKIFAVKRKAA